MAYSFLFWICFSAMFLAGFAQLFLVSRLRKEIERAGQTPPPKQARGKSYVKELFRLHRSLFVRSRTMRLYYVARGAQLLLALAAIGLITAAQFQSHNALHLIPAGR